MIWTAKSTAVALLASCTLRPPRRVTKSYRFGDLLDVYDPKDERVRALKAIYRAAEPPIDSEAWRLWLVRTPEVAIAEAVGEMRRAA